MIKSIQEKYPKSLLWGILLSFVALNSIMLALEIFYLPLVPVIILCVYFPLIPSLRTSKFTYDVFAHNLFFIQPHRIRPFMYNIH